MSSSQPNIQVVPAEEINKRFDRIEDKIDKLSDAMISLARTEEKIMAMESDKNNMIERMNRHSEKIDELNDKVNENSRTTANINKIVWLIVAAVITVAVRAFLVF
jgi:phage shock protein A